MQGESYQPGDHGFYSSAVDDLLTGRKTLHNITIIRETTTRPDLIGVMSNDYRSYDVLVDDGQADARITRVLGYQICMTGFNRSEHDLERLSYLPTAYSTEAEVFNNDQSSGYIVRGKKSLPEEWKLNHGKKISNR